MYSVIRHSYYPSNLKFNETKRFNNFQDLHQQQKGYVGTCTTNVENGQYITITFWETETDMINARKSLQKVVDNYLSPLMSKPSILLGTGPVIYNDLPWKSP